MNKQETKSFRIEQDGLITTATICRATIDRDIQKINCNLISRLVPYEHVIITGYSGAGKTTLAANIGCYCIHTDRYLYKGEGLHDAVLADIPEGRVIVEGCNAVEIIEWADCVVVLRNEANTMDKCKAQCSMVDMIVNRVRGIPIINRRVICLGL